MNTNGESSHINNTGSESPLHEATMEQQIYLLRQDLDEARNLLAAKEKRQLEEATEDERIAKILKVTLDSQANRKEKKIIHRAFTFSRFDGRKIGTMVLSWLNQFDDYFSGEAFSKIDKIKSVPPIARLAKLLYGGMLLVHHLLGLLHGLNFKRLLRKLSYLLNFICKRVVIGPLSLGSRVNLLLNILIVFGNVYSYYA